jgi:hypothetical protein
MDQMLKYFQGNCATNPFDIKPALKQGCSLSTILFNNSIDFLREKLFHVCSRDMNAFEMKMESRPKDKLMNFFYSQEVLNEYLNSSEMLEISFENQKI